MEKILEVKELCKKYKDFSLKDVSFSLEKGSIAGFIGENGAGKTTTLSAIMNLIKADSGKVYLDGIETSKLKFKEGISYLESNRDLYPDISMSDYKFFVSKAFADCWSEERFCHYEKVFGIENVKKIKELSTGMKAKFFLAVELAKQPKLLLLDEPTSGLDPLARNELLDIIKRLAENEGVSVLFSSHITSDIEHIANKVIFIHNGEIMLDMEQKDVSKRFKKIDLEQYSKLSTEAKKVIGKNFVRNFDYLIFSAEKSVERCGSMYQDAALDDVLMFLTGGKQIA